VSWVRDLLPSDAPEARLLFFNYDSTHYNDAPKKDLEDIADELLFAFEIAGVRTTEMERKRPIVFICHSYGGLVVKAALNKASQNPGRNKDLLDNIYGAMFLGTPHFGTQYWWYAHELAVRLNRLGSNPDIFVPLAVNSTYLQDMHRDFMNDFPNLHLVNFYETRELLIFKYWLWLLPLKAMVR
jgi:protein SERAC1